MFNVNNLAPFLAQLRQAEHLYVGYSGGLDSHVLLHAVVALVDPLKITALHINHSLSDNAPLWQRHCQQVSEKLAVNFKSFVVAIDDSKGGIEQAARQARYQIFESLLNKGDLLLLGHHADDQAETVLYRLLRSSGPKGLAGMPQSRVLAKGRLLRPLLAVSRDHLHHYAQAQGLCWVEDESNARLDVDRNFIRHNIIPALAERWPDAVSRINNSANLCLQSDSLTSELAQADFQGFAERQERFGCSIELSEFKKLTVNRRVNVIRFWLHKYGFAMPAKSRLETMHHNLLDAREDAMPLLVLGECELRRFNGRLYLLKSLPPFQQAATEYLWSLTEPLLIPAVGVLSARWPVTDRQLTVAFRQGGERCRPENRQHSQSLKKLFQEYQLEPWLRERIPLIFEGGQLIAVAGLFVCAEATLQCDFQWHS